MLILWGVSAGGCLEFPETSSCDSSGQCGEAAICRDGVCVVVGDPDGAGPGGGPGSDGSGPGSGGGGPGPGDGGPGSGGGGPGSGGGGPGAGGPDFASDCANAPDGARFVEISAGGIPAGELTDEEAATDTRGSGHTCALDSAARLFCWGNGLAGQLGAGPLERGRLPAAVPGCWRAVSAGKAHTCALGAGGPSRPAGSLWCWGRGRYGQLGQAEPRVEAAEPLRVGDGTDWETVSAGAEHTCGIRAGDALYCWGSARYGRLGREDLAATPEVPAPEPRHVPGPWRAVSAGLRHTCALDLDGGVHCWGSALYGRLGFDGEVEPPVESVATPRRVETLEPAGGWVEVQSGAVHTCVRHESGVLVCFGGNHLGQIGTGNTDPEKVLPGFPVYASGATSLSAGGYHTCAVVDGAVRCWGDGSLGQLGTGADPIGAPPAAPRFPDRAPATFSRVAAGGSHSCALGTDGRVFCFGDGAHGAVGDGRAGAAVRPVRVSGDATYDSLAVGTHESSCAITTTGELRCWGRNDDGVLGTGERSRTLVPTRVGAGSLFTHVAVSAGHACAVALPGGGLLCWGLGWAGQLGVGMAGMTVRPTPVRLPLPALNGLFDRIVVGSEHTCAHRIGELWCFGDNGYAQIGPVPPDPGAPSTLSPYLVPAAFGLLDHFAATSATTCALDPDRGPVCFGSISGLFFDDDGEVHDGSWETVPDVADYLETFEASPDVPRDGWITLAAGSARVCGLRGEPAEIWCRSDDSPVPHPARPEFPWSCLSGEGLCQVGETGFERLAVGNSHLCGITGDGRLLCHGDNHWGQIGAGDFEQRVDLMAEVPHPEGSVAWRDVGVATDFTCALDVEGGLFCFGRNDHGQLGDGTESVYLPVEVALP